MRILLVIAVLLFASLALADDPATYDQRFGVVATDSSGWGHPIMPVQGPQYFDQLRTAWWYNYTPSIQSYQVPGLNLFWPGYPRLYMFWRAVGTTTDVEIQNYARAAKNADPNRIIWWAMSNEPNDRGQANQAAADFAAIYLKHHKNLRIGDPTCKIMGPGLLNWTFTNSSCYQTGKSWYEEFRNAWAANPECVAYSQSVNGTNYPPQDAFCLHTYDIRWPADWRWCRDELITCYNDLQAYPETRGLSIWNTEYGDLTSPSRAQSADLTAALTLWMRNQPWMERWFLFLTHSDKHGSWPNVELIDEDGTISQLGEVYRDVQLLPAEASFYHYPFHAAHSQTSSYLRPGCTYSASIVEVLNAPGLKFYLTGGAAYSAGNMRARKYTAATGRIYKVRFNYVANYDNSKCVLAMDTSAETSKWQADVYGGSTDYVEVDLSENPVEYVAFGLVCRTNFTCPSATGEWYGAVANVTLLTCPNPPAVIDEGDYTISSNRLSAHWIAPTGGKQPIVEYQYAIGSTPSGTDVADWTSAGANTSVVRDDLSLVDGGVYYFAVRAKDSDGHWGAVGCSDGIRKIREVAGPAQARSCDLESYLGLSDLVVSAVLQDRFYVQSLDRSSGIGVIGTTSCAVGDVVSVAGQLKVVDGEAVIVGEAKYQGPGEPPRPLGVTGASSGGGSSGLQSATINSIEPLSFATGLTNVGLLVRVCGRASYVDPLGDFFYLDDGSGLQDGSGHSGIRVSTRGLPIPVPQTFVVVTGIVSTTLVQGLTARLIRPRDLQDLQYEETANYLANNGFEVGNLFGWTTIGAQGQVRSGSYYFAITSHSGDFFFASYGNYATNSGTIYQRVRVKPGRSYVTSAWSRVLHGGNTAEAAKNRIGIDPTGGTDPASPNVVWSDWDSQSAWYYSEWHRISTPIVAVLGDRVTVFLEYLQQETPGWHINCFDDAVLEEIDQP